jgi:hypothetical protein
MFVLMDVVWMFAYLYLPVYDFMLMDGYINFCKFG